MRHLKAHKVDVNLDGMAAIVARVSFEPTILICLSCKKVCQVNLMANIVAIRAVFNWVSKVITRLVWFCITTFCDWLTKLAPLSQPMGIQTKTNRVFGACVFPHLTQVSRICFEF